MKKLLSILLCVNMLAGIFTAYAEEAPQKDYSKEMALLKRAGILTTTEIDLAKTVTRAEFVDYIAKLYPKNTSFEKERYFKDVPVEYWANSSINQMVDAGLVSLNEESMFYPERNISLSEATKLLLCAAGYEHFAITRGGYPGGYMTIATENKILPKVADANAITAGEMLELMYKTLLIPIVSITTSADGQFAYSVDESETLAEQYANIFVKKGAVTSVYCATMPGSRYVEENEVCIDYQDFKLAENVNIYDLFADFVEYIYVENDDDTKTLIYAEKIDDRYNEIEIESHLLASFDDSSYALSYYPNNSMSTQKTISLPKGITVIFNGYQYNGGISEEIQKLINKDKKGSVAVKDFNRDGGYDTIIIESYKTIVVGYNNSEKTQFYNKFNYSDCIDTEGFDIVRICDKNKNPTELISLGQLVLSVAESKNGEMIEIVPCIEALEGTASYWDADSKTVMVNDAEYRVDKQVFSSGASLMGGKTYSMVVDKFGEIVYVDTPAAGYTVGYLTSIRYDNEEENMFFKIFDQTGVMAKYNLAERVKIDGVNYKSENPTSILDAMPNKDIVKGMRYDILENNGLKIYTARQVIRYILNDAGEIREIDTMYCNQEKEDADTTLSRGLDGTVLKKFYPSRAFELSAPYEVGRTICFNVPTYDDDGNPLGVDDAGNVVPISDDDDLYSTLPKIDPNTEESYYMQSYKYDPNYVSVEVLVNIADASMVEEKKSVIVDRISEEVNEDDEIEKLLYGYLDGKATTLTVPENVDVSNIDCGDVVKISRDSAGTKIVSVIKTFDADTQTFENRPNNLNPYWWNASTANAHDFVTWRHSGYQLVKGYVYHKDKLYISVGYTKGASDLSGYLNVPIIVYDKELRKNNLYVGSVNDLMGYKQVGNNCSAVVISHSHYGKINTVYVYK